ncbi:MAG: DUF4214 domain-containing protein [Saccharofermentans sp.]|nr:DUF4214 domain-containing protein [Saccharofermentans sp.]
MRRVKSNVITAALLVVSIIFSQFLFVHEVQAAGGTASISYDVTYHQTEARSMLDTLNKWRVQDHECWNEDNASKTIMNGGRELIYDSDLEQIAMIRAYEIVLYFAHQRPDGTGIETITSNGVRTNGENILYGTNVNMDKAFELWVEENEPYAGQGHRRNMLNSKFTHVGIACIEYNGMKYWVQEFGKFDLSRDVNNTEAFNDTVTVTSPVVDSCVPLRLGVPNAGYLITDYANYGIPHPLYYYHNFKVCLLRGNVAVQDVTDQATINWNLVDESGKSYNDKYTYDGTTLSFRTLGKYTLTGTVTYNGETADIGNETRITINPAYMTDPGIVATYDKKVVYEGVPVYPELKLENNGEVLVEGVDYTAEYFNNNIIGDYGYIRVDAIGEHYQGYNILRFEIVQPDLSDATVENISAKPYSGSEITQNPVVKFGGKVVDSANYSVTYENNIEVGTAKLTITGSGIYTGSVTKEFEIVPCDIAEAAISDIPESVTYTGEAAQPVPSVTFNGKVLTPDVDYEVEYSDNVNVGTAKVIVNGIGNYTGSCEKTFVINAINIIAGTVTIDKSTYEFNGKAVEPEPVVVVDGKVLVRDTDYIVSYSGSTKAGSAFVVIIGVDSYRGTLTKRFTITPCDISNATISGINNSYPLLEDSVEPSPVVTINGVILKEDVDYTVTYSNNTATGTATVSISGIGNYTGSCSVEFSIVGLDINESKIVGLPTSMAYSGSALEPSVVVKYDDNYLVKNVDYAVSFENNINAGTATMVITGLGKYSGDKKVTFTINKGDISLATISGENSFKYTGSDIVPELKVVSNNGIVLEEGKDYEITYSDNLNAGEASAKLVGINNFKGSKTYSFSIASVSADEVSVSLPAKAEYIGSAIKPIPVVRYGAVTLTESQDYEVTYGDNTEIGEGTVTITLKGNYSGTINKSFDITKISIENAELSGFEDEVLYTGSAINPDVVVKIGDKTLVNGVDYTLMITDNTSVGTATITVTGTGVYEGTVLSSFKIIRGVITNARIYGVPKSSVYTGKAIEPSVILLTDEGALEKGVHYTCKYENNTNVGEAKITFTGIGDYSGSIEMSFAITPADISSANISPLPSSVYTGSPVKSPVLALFGRNILEEGVDYDVEYQNNTNAGTATAVITGKGNFTGSVSEDFVIAQAEITPAVVSLDKTEYEFTGEGIEVVPEVTLDGVTLVQDVDYVVTYKNNETVGSATAIITGVGNYRGTVTTNFSIVPASVSNAVITGVPSSVTYRGEGIEFKPVVKFNDATLIEGEDYEVIYANNVNCGDGVITVKGINNFKGSVSTTFAITRASIEDAKVGEIASVTYNPTGAKATPSLTFNGQTLVKDKDYTYSYSDNKKVGEATVTILGLGNFEGEISTKYQIVPREITADDITGIPESVPYNGGIVYVYPSIVIDGVILQLNSDYALNNFNNMSVGEAKLIVVGMGNYTGKVTFNYQITAVSIKDAKVTAVADQEYTGSAIKPSISVTLNNMKLREGSDYTIEYKNNVNVGIASIVITGIGSYKDSITINFKINKKQSTGVQGFCERLYTCALGRASDPSGVQSWVDAIKAGATGAKAAEGFFFSAEFTNKNYSNKEFVVILYLVFMDREPDAAGLNAWASALDKGASRVQVFNGFVESQEWANTCFKYGIKSGGNATPNIRIEPSAEILAFAERLYTTCLGRSADASGLRAWAEALANREGSGAKVAHGFFFSQEFESKNLSNEDFVRRCYLTFMNREPDPSGFNAWVGALDSGATREQVFNGFVKAPEFVSICEDAGIIAY